MKKKFSEGKLKLKINIIKYYFIKKIYIKIFRKKN